MILSLLTAAALATGGPVEVWATVVGIDGGPIENARVAVWDSSFAVDGTMSPDADGVQRLWEPPTGLTNAKGEARFSAPSSNGLFSSGKRRAVSVTADGHAPFFGAFEVQKRRLQLGRITLAAGADIHVKVRCPDEPCPAEMSVQLSMGTDVRHAVTVESVAVFKGLAPGKGKATSRWMGGKERSGEVLIDARPGVNQVILDAVRTGGGLELSGKWVDARASAPATLGPVAQTVVISAQCGGVSRGAALLPDNAFVISDLPDSDCELVISEGLFYLPPIRVRSAVVRAHPPRNDLVITLPALSEYERRKQP